ncbi:SIR2 family protein [Mycobacterium sp. 852002-10029_SCH5224772]|uniref:SIR2 family protein n=1 Tax=Mycobacterium sp. 852002-10029_SCH5224772 TaxID=1834083 RepID=UPI0009EE2287|nr:SIR2 family protein [Mycobacterium sp. 852002-10029_SCH5224772]
MTQSTTSANPSQDRPVEVFAAFTRDWQSLTSAGDESEEDRAAILSAERSLADELRAIANAECLIVLAGLGTSLGIRSTTPEVAYSGAPSMADLWSDVEELDSFKSIQDALTSSVVATRNLEYVLSDAQARLALDQENEDLQIFVTEAEGIVLDRCTFISPASDVSGHEIFLRKVARRSTRLRRTQIFTTNYDLAFETAAARTHFNVIDGFGLGGVEFDGASFDIDFVRRRPHEQITLEPSVFHLLKLHGSVDWDASSGVVKKVQQRPENPVLIYPSAAKYQLSYQQPYLEFMSRFQIALRQSDVGLIIVGFGFNDEHIVAPIAASLRSNVGLRAVVVTPGARSENRPDSISWIEGLIKAGDKRLSILNGTFDDLVRLLPGMPSSEERDAHVERVASADRMPR